MKRTGDNLSQIANEINEAREIRKSLSNFQIIDFLGAGSFGHVVLAIERQTEIPFAIKIISKIHGSTIKSQVKLLSQLQYPTIIKINHHFENQKYFFIIMEYVKGMTLKQLIYMEYSRPMSLDNILTIMSKLILTVMYLHEKNIVHLDLKPQNILVNNKGQLKIIDFGVSKKLKKCQKQLINAGTPCYMPPQCFSPFQINPKNSDWWAIGIIFYQLCTKTIPFKTIPQIQSNNGPQLNNLPEELKYLIQNLLQKDSSKRIKPQELIENKILDKYIRLEQIQQLIFFVEKDEIEEEALEFFKQRIKIYKPLMLSIQKKQLYRVMAQVIKFKSFSYSKLSNQFKTAIEQNLFRYYKQQLMMIYQMHLDLKAIQQEQTKFTKEKEQKDK